MSAAVLRPGLTGRVLRRLCQASAVIGGLLLIAIAFVTLASVAGRVFWSSPILGDVELVQLACAIGLACFLPYTQWQGTNIMVDFFTARASAPNKRRLDALGSLLLAAMTGLIGWRTAAGAMAAHEYGETSMLMSIPIWIPYALMVPGLLLTAVVSLYIAWCTLRFSTMTQPSRGDPRE
ncbi:MAG: TRAP transporter small permease [Burkholderiales bacterium]|nr:TRAP transporter small permease [Burkholderiales bacterium]